MVRDETVNDKNKFAPVRTLNGHNEATQFWSECNFNTYKAPKLLKNKNKDKI